MRVATHRFPGAFCLSLGLAALAASTPAQEPGAARLPLQGRPPGLFGGVVPGVTSVDS